MLWETGFLSINVALDHRSAINAKSAEFLGGLGLDSIAEPIQKLCQTVVEYLVYA